MEGWFWRCTDRASGRVVVVLCGINEHPSGAWATLGIALHPGNVVRSAAVDGASASTTAFEVRAGDGLQDDHLWADAASLRAAVGGVQVRLAFDDLAGWPHRMGAGGILSALPFLGQYWHPHVLGGRASGSVVVGSETWRLTDADVYAEKNWGAGFPEWWWWGQAQGFPRRDVCVAFGGGRLTAGPFGVGVTGCVLRVGDEVVRFAPPAALVRASFEDGRWQVRARRPGWRVELDGDAGSAAAAVLPVPIPEERRNVDRDLEVLAGRLRLRAWHRGVLVVDDVSELAGLEVGSTSPTLAAHLAAELQVPLPSVG